MKMKDYHMHPIFAQALYPFAPPDSQARKLADYIRLLDTMDWQYQFSDDHEVFKEGQERVDQARKLQVEVDPQGVIWMNYPQSREHGAPQPYVNKQ